MPSSQAAHPSAPISRARLPFAKLFLYLDPLYSRSHQAPKEGLGPSAQKRCLYEDRCLPPSQAPSPECGVWVSFTRPSVVTRCLWAS